MTSNHDWNKIQEDFYKLIDENPEEVENQDLLKSRSELLQHEMKNLVGIIIKLPKKSFAVNEISQILSMNEFHLITSSLITLKFILEFLSDKELIDGNFIKKLGILDLTPKLILNISSNELDQQSCGGINKIEKPNLLFNYVYTDAKCPFCKQPVQTNEIKIAIIDRDQRTAISYKLILAGERLAFHKN